MSLKLSNIRNYGRYKHIETKQEVNVKIGKNLQCKTDHLFYLNKGKRIYITDSEFYGENKKWIEIDF